LALAALGVVYGDIGTSPLYALRECFSKIHGLTATHENVLGVLSLVFWAMTFVVSFKYIVVLLRADNRGEGGIMALLALVRHGRDGERSRRALILLGLFGAALLYGDGVITPPVSVLGAVEGLELAAPGFERFVVPIAVAILIVLFAFQRHGTHRVGFVFGPVMIVWFLMISITGAIGISRAPSVLWAINPYYGFRFFVGNGALGFLILGSVVLVLTGGEALYADMGHFGRRPIRVAWFGMAFPALLLNYFGQGALLLVDPGAAENPFYRLVPAGLLYPAIGVATAAAVVASQALISGSFSLTRQAMQLGYSPRVTVRHTSKREEGQIYIPEVNQALAVLCIALVIGFQSSDALAGAYGIAVTGTMAITTVLFSVVARELWHWSTARVIVVTTTFLAVDLAFFGANLVKFFAGGWFPLTLATIVFVLMTTWKRGRGLVSDATRSPLSAKEFVASFAKTDTYRVPGVAVFMTSDPVGASPVLLHHLKHNKVVHRTVILLSIQNEDVPTVPAAERIEHTDLGHGFHSVVARYGFVETPDVPEILPQLARFGLDVPISQVSYFLGRETVLPTGKGKLAGWRKRLFILMSRNAQPATAFFNLPPNRVVELGAQVQV
jgi:KUP system potassium uptake protein